MAVEIQNEIEQGIKPVNDSTVTVEELAEAYLSAVKAKGVARKTQWKYDADLKKLKEFCGEIRLQQARQFTEIHFYQYREWLIERKFADKTIQGALVLAKQLLKWAWRQGMLRDYRLAGVTMSKAKAKPQPCFTSEQVDSLIDAAFGEQKAAFALMGYAGLRIGEVEQLHWEDIRFDDDRPVMIHVCRGGSNGSPKDKEDRFVPVHPQVEEQLALLSRGRGPIFKEIAARRLLKDLKDLCEALDLEDPRKFKLHSFRHHFASLCANSHVAHRKALAWLGHSSSTMLDLYYHLHDDDSLEAMSALANAGHSVGQTTEKAPAPEGNLRATGQSTIDKRPQAPEVRELVETLCGSTERVGFEPTVLVRVHGTSNAARSATPAPLRLTGPKARPARQKARILTT